MNIAHVLSSFELGGQERVALDLARIQRERGHRVLAISLAEAGEGALADAFRAAGVTVDTIAKRLRLDPSLPVRLAARLRRDGVDVVHTHNPYALVYGAPAAFLAGAAAVHSKHGMNPDPPRRMWLRRGAARLVDAYVAVTPTLAARALAERDCPPSSLKVISNGIDVHRFAPNARARQEARAELGLSSDAWVVGTVGRLAPEKDQALLIDALAPLLGAQVKLVLVGDGPSREALRARIARLGLGSHVSLLGPRDDVERLLAAFDAFALTSRTEGLPLVLLEAMATAIPVVSTSVGGIPDLVEHGATGLLCAAGDRDRLTKHLTSLHADSALAARLAYAGRREVVRRYSVARMAREYEALYSSALRDHGSIRRAPLRG